MQQFKIKRLIAKNFLCYGEIGIDINFETMGNIILIKGKNLDVINEDEQGSSNGVGKSSIGEAIVYALTGECIRKLKKDRIINNKSGKKLLVEIWVDDLHIVSKRSPTSLAVFQLINGEEVDVSRGTMDETQKWINSQLGFTIEDALKNLLILTDNNAGSFLESAGPQKRSMCENYFGLDIYGKYSSIANKQLLNKKTRIKEIAREYENSEREEESAQRRIDKVKEQEIAWKALKQHELSIIITKCRNKSAEMKKTDIGVNLSVYNDAQEKISLLNIEVTKKDKKSSEIQLLLDQERIKIEKIRETKNKSQSTLQQLKLDYNKSSNLIKENQAKIVNQESNKCLECGAFDKEAVNKSNAIIDEENIKIESLKNLLLKENDDLSKYTETLNELMKTIKNIENEFRDINQEITSFRKEIATLSKIEKPEISLNEKLLEEQYNELKNQALAKKDECDGPSPYVENIKNAIEEKEEKIKQREQKKNELNEASKIIPYFEFWQKAFGENGIRKFIIDGIIPALNNRVAYWLNYLIDGKISLNFDNALDEKIERFPNDGDDYVYSSMSGGERRRLNLAVSQAFSYVTTLTTGICPSLIFLDEVTTNIDPIGVQGVYNMIVELAKERQVLITTHDQGLLDTLQGCDSINLVKENGITTIV